jgi:hypothetical protein
VTGLTHSIARRSAEKKSHRLRGSGPSPPARMAVSHVTSGDHLNPSRALLQTACCRKCCTSGGTYPIVLVLQLQRLVIMVIVDVNGDGVCFWATDTGLGREGTFTRGRPCPSGGGLPRAVLGHPVGVPEDRSRVVCLVSEPVNDSDLTICSAEFRFGPRTISHAESEFGATPADIRITSQSLRLIA